MPKWKIAAGIALTLLLLGVIALNFSLVDQKKEAFDYSSIESYDARIIDIDSWKKNGESRYSIVVELLDNETIMEKMSLKSRLGLQNLIR